MSALTRRRFLALAAALPLAARARLWLPAASPAAPPALPHAVSAGTTAMPAGTMVTMIIRQEEVVTLGAGRAAMHPFARPPGGAVTWPATFRFPDGASPTLSTRPELADVLTMVSDGRAWYASLTSGLR